MTEGSEKVCVREKEGGSQLTSLNSGHITVTTYRIPFMLNSSNFSQSWIITTDLALNSGRGKRGHDAYASKITQELYGHMDLAGVTGACAWNWYLFPSQPCYKALLDTYRWMGNTYVATYTSSCTKGIPEKLLLNCMYICTCVLWTCTIVLQLGEGRSSGRE